MNVILKYCICCFFLYFFCFDSTGKEISFDSSDNLLNSNKIDTNQLNLLNKRSWKYYGLGQYDSAITYANYTLQLSDVLLQKVVNKQIKATIQLKKQNAFNCLGNSHFFLGNYSKTIEFYFSALKIAESNGDNLSVANSYNNIGIVYSNKGNFQEAIIYYLDAIKVRKKIGDKKGLATSYNNLGSAYTANSNYKEALKYQTASLKIRKEIGDLVGIADVNSGIADIYVLLGKYAEAERLYKTCLNFKDSIDDQAGVVYSLLNIADMYLLQNRFSEAEKNLINAKKIAEKIHFTQGVGSIYKLLTQIDSAKSDYKAAYDHQKIFFTFRDSLLNDEGLRKTMQIQMQYEFEKKELIAKAEQAKEDLLAAQEKKTRRLIIYIVVCFLLLVLSLSTFLVKRLLLNKRQKKTIEKKNVETEQQKKIIEEKNKEITDSINYARRIQQSKLPSKEEICSFFKKSFILFRPKEIVSGDFYFYYKTQDKVYIAVADCTGHGVPGALMSIIGSEKLEDAINRGGSLTDILNNLNNSVKVSLRQNDDESAADGLDIALCSVDIVSSKIQYVGANRPLWIIRKGCSHIEEMKPTKKSIGGLTKYNQNFDSYEVSLLPGDSFYLFTDGFADQFGGVNGTKLKTTNFKQLLVKIHQKEMSEQEFELNSFIESWRGKYEQVDDILVVGICL